MNFESRKEFIIIIITILSFHIPTRLNENFFTYLLLFDPLNDKIIMNGKYFKEQINVIRSNKKEIIKMKYFMKIMPIANLKTFK